MTSRQPPPLTRQAAEQLERELLRPGSVLSVDGWARPQAEPPDPYRTCFARDRDRVLHSAAFRRLKHKTQVFVSDRDDFYRTRLTHTLEVCQIARFLAKALRLNESLAEVLALVHDIGHPPFGHEGERILHDVTGVPFDHNSQALRIVDVLESPYHDRRGLNLTHVVRRMILKHGGAAGRGAAETHGHVLEAQVADLADSTAYQHHDLEDGLRAHVFDRGDLNELSIWRQALDDAGPTSSGHHGVKATLNAMLKRSLNDLLDHSTELMHEAAFESPDAVEAHGQALIAFTPERAAQHAELMRFLYARFYRSDTVVSSRAVAEEALSMLSRHFHTNPRELPTAYQRRLDSEGLDRTVCDYIAGMTDRYALQKWKQLSPVAPTMSAAPTSDIELAASEQDHAHVDERLEASVAALGERIGHTFVDTRLGAMALTHASARALNQPPNERLEFLGDAVLGLVVAQECYLRFPDQPEGELSRIKATAVNRHALYDVAERWSLESLLVLGPGFRDDDEVPPSVIADAVEAVLGAVYLDGGLAPAHALIAREFGVVIDTSAAGRRSRNAKSELQALTQGEMSQTPNYRLLDEAGPDHEKVFTVAAMIGDRELAVATGRNKRQAEMRAAKEALHTLRDELGIDIDAAAPKAGQPAGTTGSDDDTPDDDADRA